MSYNPNDFGMIIITFTRDEIENFNHVEQLDVLENIKADALNYEGKLNIVITGYERDERELWEIKEVRDYFDFLDRVFPYWFFFLIRDIPKNKGPLGIIQSLLVPIDTILVSTKESKILQMNLMALEKFFEIHFFYLNKLIDELKMSLDERKRISDEIIKAFA